MFIIPDWGTGLDWPPLTLPPVPSKGLKKIWDKIRTRILRQIFFSKIYLFENFDDSLEKKVDGLEELIAEVSCEELGMPTNGPLVLFRVIPEWNVDLSGTFRENDCAAAEEPRPVGDKGNLL